MADWIIACSTDRLGHGEMFSFDYNKKKLLLTNINGKIFATDRLCTHAEADLANGILTENGLTCPLHFSVFNIDNGIPQNPPAEDPLQTYRTKIQDNDILIEV
ncbi:MAG: non-heme iron oxygenase ferredoxin subunit [Crenarchaeota archaeon]|nr:non-heme iron oxygenase ferredoxin subunit [Thermoproteota archaeon]MDA1124502.1 non-heme iron oxygenase ferredoxin subunit [Thermoproteota archaeon]